jgi:predicted small metal-binding protein
MRKVLHCADVMEGCAQVLHGATEDEVMQQAGQHAARDHGVSNPPAEVVAKIRAAIREEQQTPA